MTRHEVISAAMATNGAYTYTPVQLQKLLFLIDQRLAPELGGPHFDFKPYHYGPFDKAVYAELDSMEQKGLVEILREPHLKLRKFRLTAIGENFGRGVLDSADPKAVEYVSKLADFVRTASFPSLVSAIYQAYPEMRVNSVFVG